MPDAQPANSVSRLQADLARFLNFTVPERTYPYQIDEVVEKSTYTRARISYTGDDGQIIPAYLLLPDQAQPTGAVLVHHQHHGQRHLGKSEVCGLAGDPLQAIGPALASRGIIVLAPDSICFEDRRRGATGTQPTDDDVGQHYAELCARLLRGDTLMRKVLSDSAQAISVLLAHPQVDPRRIGILGHSYGGTTAIFHGALDPRIRFACASGAAATYTYRLQRHLGIEMASVIPGFVEQYDLPDLIFCFASRPLLLLSATNDPHSAGASRIVGRVRRRWSELGIQGHLTHRQYEGSHAPTRRRFDEMVHWIVTLAGPPAS